MNDRHSLRLVIFLAAILALFSFHSAGAAAASPITCGTWSVVSSPSPFTLSFLSSVAAVSPTDVWAVGDGVNGTTSHTLIEHWNGTNWHVVPSSTGQDQSLSSVTALAANNVWAVGSSGSVARTLIEHWNGTMWSVVKSPNGKQRYNSLASVAAVSPTDIWAVGYGGLNFDIEPQALIEHWDGTTWNMVSSPDDGSAYTNLTGVTAVSSTDVWAVGYSYSLKTRQYSPLSEHWNGTKWNIVQAPGSGNDPNLQSVTATDASHVLAVGYLSDRGGSLIERWNGSRWHIMSSPPNSEYVFLYGLAASSVSSAWTVGGGETTVTMHWNGTTWKTVPSPNGPNFANKLNGVAMPTATTAWAVGFSEDSSTNVSSTLIEYYC